MERRAPRPSSQRYLIKSEILNLEFVCKRVVVICTTPARSNAGPPIRTPLC
jgi:hypothetical protein